MRGILIELVERELIETQESVGMQVIGQFRDLDDANSTMVDSDNVLLVRPLLWADGSSTRHAKRGTSYATGLNRRQTCEAVLGGVGGAACRRTE